MGKFLPQLDNIFEACADELALVSAQESLTYKQLNQKANAIAAAIQEAGIKAGQVIGVFVGSRIDAIATILAVLRVGCAYLPMDPVYPRSRLEYMLENSQSVLLVTDNKRLQPKTAKTLTFSSIDFSTTEFTPAKEAGEFGYIIYTSGSTGQPKGVMMLRSVLDNLIRWQNQRYTTGRPLRTAQFSSLSFDVSFQEIFSTFTAGGTLYLIEDHIKKDFRALLEFLNTHTIERIFMPYIAVLNLAQWAVRLESFPRSLREVITAGEQLIIGEEIRKFFTECNEAVFSNQYGPSESHVVTEYVLPSDVSTWKEVPPIGIPIDKAEIYILDENAVPVGRNIVGELYIGGDVLAAGYVNNDSETNKRFVEVIIEGKLQKLYRTGDLAQLAEDNQIHYKGRIDSQVKVDGYRVEVSEVESILLRHEAVSEAAVAPLKGKTGKTELILFVVTDGNAGEHEIKQWMLQKAPHYMVPKYWVLKDSLSKTPTGKIDRKSMLEEFQALGKEGDSDANIGPNTQKSVLRIVLDELGNHQCELDAGLGEAGMTSLVANQISARLFDELSIDIPAYRLFQFRDINALLKHILDKEALSPNANLKDNNQSPDKDSVRDVAIIGISLNVPGANSIDKFWKNLVNGIESITFFDSQEQVAPGYVNARGLINDPTCFDANFFKITPTEAEFIDPQQRIMLELAWHALEDAGYVPGKGSTRIGVYCGTGNNSYYLNNVLNSGAKLNEFGSLQAMIANEKDYTATRIAHKLNLNGPAINILTACSTSLVAICEAVESIRTSACDIALAGGASVSFPQEQPYYYQEGGIFSKDGHTRTFDTEATGTVFSDGGAVVVLKRLDYAMSDGDRIYGVIKGVATNNDGADKSSFSAPSIIGQKNVILSAQLDGGIKPGTLGYVEAHGTATPLGDPIEIDALREAFETYTSEKQFCGIGSIKSNFGHLTAAAGIVGLIKSTLAAKFGIIPATINFQNENPELRLKSSPFFVASHSQQWKVDGDRRTAAVSSFGIGGTNAHVIVQNYCKPAANRQWMDENNSVPICISAKTEHALNNYIDDYIQFLAHQKDEELPIVGINTIANRDAFSYRVSVIANTTELAVKQLKQKQGAKINAKPKGYRNLILLFPGQGVQTIKMGQQLYSRNRLFRKYFDECYEILLGEHGLDLKSVIFSDSEQLNKTINTQPAIFTVSYALARMLVDLGIRPTHALGHSIGELVAATIAEVFDLKSALGVVVARARVMQDQPIGAMASVPMSAQELQTILPPTVSVAADNSPSLCTVSGAVDSIMDFIQNLEEKGIQAKRLNTSHAFHSPLMEGARNCFIERLKEIKLSAPQMPFISCVTGAWITDKQATDIEYWADQIVSPVMFKTGAEHLDELEEALLIEVGPRKVLTGLCLQCLNSNNDLAHLQLMPNPGSDTEALDVNRALGEIWAGGISLAWDQLFDIGRAPKMSLPTYPFQRKKFYIATSKEPAPCISEVRGVNSMSVGSTAPSLPSFQSPNLNDQSIGINTNMKEAIIEKLKDLFSDSSGMDLQGSENDASFFELGLDSLFLTQASLQLKKEFKVSISFRELLNDADTFDKLSERLQAEGVNLGAEMQSNSAAISNAAPVVNVADQNTSGLQAPTVPVGTGLNSFFIQQMQLINQQMALLTSAVVGGATGGNIAAGQTSTEVKTTTHADQSKDIVSGSEKSKVPFGASVRINVKRSNELTQEQQRHLDEISERYCKKLKNSKIFAQENRKHLADPRVVSGFRSTLKELVFPIVVNKSKGAYLWDIDDNQYIDYTCGFGSNMFGNGADFIRNAVAEQLETGYEIGPQNPLVADVSDMFCKMTGNQRVAFCNTGSEAVLGAVRLARTVTAKDKVIMFENDYHGINDEVIVSRGVKGNSIPAAAGIPTEAVQNAIILDYGDEKSLDYIRDNADDIAAVLIEPVQSRYPELQPKEFLKKLRKICTEGEMAFIFDEVITGFRIHKRGAQGYYGIESDLATYGKVIGGGMPIGVIAGKKTFMDALDGGHWQFGDDSAPEVGVTYFAGTFVRHPLALAAARSVLTHLQANPNLQSELNERATKMVAEINQYCQSVGAPIYLPNCGSLFKVKIPQDIPYEELLYVLLREKGIHIWDARPCFITTAHTDADIQYFIDTFKQSVDEMQAQGFLPIEKSEQKSKVVEFDRDNPPVPGARLGKTPEGSPAWFVQDPERPGKYKMLTKAS